MNILLLIDSIEYTRTNCYQHQLYETILDDHENVASLHVMSIDSILDFYKIGENLDLSLFSHVVSTLKLRTLVKHLDAVKFVMSGRKLWVYEQDPWESFADTATYPGSYERIYGELNVVTFLNTSKWWSDFINRHDIRSKFVNMWVLPKYCTGGKPWEERKIDVAFCGQMHPYRKELVDNLENNGIRVTILPTQDYKCYLESLDDVKVFVSCEKVTWSIDGKDTAATLPWIKSIEASARGCFVVRNIDDEFLWTFKDIERSGLIRPYGQLKSASDIVKNTLMISAEKASEIIDFNVNIIKTNNRWRSVVQVLKEHSKS